MKFRKTGALPEYHGYRSDFTKPEHLTGRLNLLDFQDGDEVEVCEADAKRLVKDFPANFSITKKETKKEKEAKAAAKKNT